MTGRCPSCRRFRATASGWQAFRTTTCNDGNCAWGGDRCWAVGDCGIPAIEVSALTAAARAMRGGKSWKNVPHPVITGKEN